jgi:hypothetical protein
MLSPMKEEPPTLQWSWTGENSLAEPLFANLEGVAGVALVIVVHGAEE